MNEILQKRIEEKSKELAQKYFPNEMNVWARKNLEAQYVESACKEIATFALQNQWISVEEGLPKEGELVFMKCKNNDINTFCSGVYEGIKDEWNEDGVGYVDNVTHWMPIPNSVEIYQ